jgi:UDP-glucose 4-epimerase
LSTIRELVGSDVAARHEAPRPGDVRHSLAAIDLAGERIGYRPKVNLAEGLKRTIKAY